MAFALPDLDCDIDCCSRVATWSVSHATKY